MHSLVQLLEQIPEHDALVLHPNSMHELVQLLGTQDASHEL